MKTKSKKITTNNQAGSLSQEDYVQEDGLKCPFCHVVGPIEGSHSFDYESGEATHHVVCSSCENRYTEVYEFEGWLQDDEPIGNAIDSCPHCGADISEEYLEGIEINGHGILNGSAVCPECDEELSALLRISGWVKP